MLTTDPIALLLGVAAASTTAAVSLPQVFRTARSSSTAGLSDVTWLIMALTFSSWLLWGVVSRDLFVIATNVAALPGALWVLWRIGRDGGLSLGRAALSGLLALLALSAQALAGPVASLLAVSSLTIATRAVQLVKVRAARDISGVSPYPWVVSVVSQACWLGYGMLTSNLVVAAHAPLGAAANLALLHALRRRRIELSDARM